MKEQIISKRLGSFTTYWANGLQLLRQGRDTWVLEFLYRKRVPKDGYEATKQSKGIYLREPHDTILNEEILVGIAMSGDCLERLVELCARIDTRCDRCGRTDVDETWMTSVIVAKDYMRVTLCDICYTPEIFSDITKEKLKGVDNG